MLDDEKHKIKIRVRILTFAINKWGFVRVINTFVLATIIIAATHSVRIISICDIVSIDDDGVIIYKDLFDRASSIVVIIATIMVVEETAGTYFVYRGSRSRDATIRVIFSILLLLVT